MIRSLLLLLSIVFISSTQMYGQAKIGYLNMGIILENMPESAKADSMLRVFQDSLQKANTQLEQTFATKYKVLQDSAQYITVNRGKQMEQELLDLQQKIQTFQQQGAVLFEQRRAKHLQPILQKVGAVISEIGKSEAYSYIFDTSSGGFLLYGEESDNITDRVIAKLK